MFKSIVKLVLITAGIIAIVYAAWRISIHLMAEEGFWFSYYCSEWPVTLSETDLNHDKQISRSEASYTCMGWLNRHEINGRACIEYMEPKTGVPVYTACRLESNN